MALFNIVGLNVTTYEGNSYVTIRPDSDRILHEATGKGITKRRVFTKYIVYIVEESRDEIEPAYYAVHLSEHHSASFGGRLCSGGSMSVAELSEELPANITHVPLGKLLVGLEPAISSIRNFTNADVLDSDVDDVRAYLHNEPDTFAFEFSRDGNDERTPYGYARVNMKLFQQKI